jgi:hypothetical protein
MDSRWACPPESFSARVPALSVRPTNSSISSTRAAGMPYSEPNVASCSRAVSRSKKAEPCSCTPIRPSNAVLRGHTGWPSRVIVPESGCRSPSIISTRVVLPAPFGPRIPKNSPSPTASETSSTAATVP